MRAQEEHIYESTQIKAHRGEHTYESTEESTWTGHKSHSVWKFTGKVMDTKPRRAILCGNLQGKCRTPIPRSTFCAHLRCRNTYGLFRNAILCSNLQEKCRLPRTTSIKHRALALTVRTRSVWPHCLGNKRLRVHPRIMGYNIDGYSDLIFICHTMMRLNVLFHGICYQQHGVGLSETGAFTANLWLRVE